MNGSKLSIGALAAVLVVTGFGGSETPLTSPAQAKEKSCISVNQPGYNSDENAACLGYRKYRGEAGGTAPKQSDACAVAKGNAASLMGRGYDGDCQCTSKPNPPFGGVKRSCKIVYFYMAPRPTRPHDTVVPTGNDNSVR